MSALETLQDVLVDMLKDTYDAELQLVEALPELGKAATNSALKRAIRDHLAETKTQVARLEEAFELIGEPARRKKCKAMAGLVKEGKEATEEEGKSALVDACIIAAAQKVEHYEISAYGTMVSQARMMGMDELATLLETTLNEEKTADVKLTEIAEGPLLAKSLPKAAKGAAKKSTDMGSMQAPKARGRGKNSQSEREDSEESNN